MSDDMYPIWRDARLKFMAEHPETARALALTIPPESPCSAQAEMLTALRMVIREFADFEMCASERRAMDAAIKAVRNVEGKS